MSPFLLRLIKKSMADIFNSYLCSLNPKILLIECCNFIDFPTGGQLSFAKHMITCFDEELVLMGLTTEKGTVGKWSKLKINGKDYDYFPYLYLPKKSKRPLIPMNLSNYLALRKYKQVIRKVGIENVLTQNPYTALAIRDFNFKNTCFRFAGIENPLRFSRYKIAKAFAFLYDKFVLQKLSRTNLILATADYQSIETLIARSKGFMKRDKIKQFPTRVDTEIFQKKSISRSEFSIPFDQLVIVTTGRLGWYKGWKFMIDSFKLFKLNNANAHFYFIGNGEDFGKITSYINKLKLESSVHLVGFKNPFILAQYLNMADLFIMGSYKEGWSTSLLEAIACGTPACVTNFSSSKDIINDGVTGYVAESHDEIKFVELMNKCIKIDRSKLPLKSDIDKYAVSNLKHDLLELWPLL
jgi:glycosyltransferase involved in cell wall biosynthesis